ncbi:glycosyltransferase family 4 protein [Maribacter sp. 1_MG-2023]|uniref:glycosyltransferase family 4 protein n=1 Tax=Maribacter sp. 1_MG-2023 TaxID=3062677 RepID=UPI0026E3A2D0|nr:glycosyltransferase family 4 protein [Maribacter sp. 1_MG-2023]MDO6470712.1 glycosyltransferase family 4 protein [Maribacter sp. 1_MG-2023]
MKNVAFYFNNIGIDTIDCRNIINSNPGIGGSEFAILTIANQLSVRENELNITLYSERKGLFPHEINYNIINTIENAILSSIENKVDYFLVDHKRIPKELISKYSTVKFVIWAHNFLKEMDLEFYYNAPNVIRIINVGREQRDLHRDHKVSFKMDYIYNALSLSSIKNYKVTSFPFEKRGNNVIYMGSIVPSKGFHVLAKAWPKILKHIPDAQLYVLGSGKLYNRDLKLGEKGIAVKGYEDKFMNYLIEDNKIHSSVHFMGVLGQEKNDILLKCRVGVPNPSGISETFGFTAIEMQAMGCKVTTIKCPGYLDTVFNKNDLYKSTNSLANHVIMLLKAKKNDYNDVLNFIDSNFSFEVITLQWEELFQKSLDRNYLLHGYNEMNNAEFRLKFIKEFLRKIKTRFKFLKNFITIEFILTKTIDKINKKWIKTNNL